MAKAPDFTIRPAGPFSLAESVGFGFGQRHAERYDGVMRMAFCLDDYQGQVGVELRQARALDAPVHGTILRPVAGDAGAGSRVAGEPGGPEVDPAAVAGQAARVLSLDHDGADFLQVGERDPVIGKLQAAAPGLRPPLFYSPYEAAAWAVLSTRRQPRQAAQLRDRLGQAHGAVFELAGQQVTAMPTPEQLMAVESFPGLPPDRLQRLHGVARAALHGDLDAARLAALDPAQAMAELQRIPGIGPFYSSLIVIRATGLADVLPESEPKALALAGQLYGLPGPPAPDQFRAMAEPWRPFRTWAAVLIRAVTARLPAGPG